MTERAARGRLLNSGGELIAEGRCWVEEGSATLEPDRTPGVIQKQQGELTLELDSGRLIQVSGKAMVVRIWPQGRNGTDVHRRLYRLRLIEPNDVIAHRAQEANAAGAAGEGAPAVSTASGRPREGEETPAAS